MKESFYGIDFSNQNIIIAALILAFFVSAVFMAFVLWINKRLDREQEMIDQIQREGRLEDLLPDEDEDRSKQIML
jgi:hypothetical protein